MTCAAASQTDVPVGTNCPVKVVPMAYRLLSSRVGAALVRSSKLALSLVGGVAVSFCCVTLLLMGRNVHAAVLWSGYRQYKQRLARNWSIAKMVAAYSEACNWPQTMAGQWAASCLKRVSYSSHPVPDWHCASWTTSRRYAMKSSAIDGKARSTMAA